MYLHKLNQQDAEQEEVPIIDSQYIFLASHWAVSSCSLCATLRLSGVFDAQVAHRSWQDLLARHPMMRARFSIPSGTTSFRNYHLLVLKNPTPPEIPITDLRYCDRQTQQQRINDEIHRCINDKWSIDQWPLHRFFVLSPGRFSLRTVLHQPSLNL